MSILVTGFGPFPGVPRNLSQVVAEALPARIAGRAVRRAVLSTRYEDVRARLPALIAEYRPEVALCLGVGRPGAFALETLARNLGTDETRMDQAGRAHRGPIEPNGPENFAATLPIEPIAARLAECGYRVAISDDAGGYVCNFAFYVARRAIADLGLATRCGFFHLPARVPEADEADQVARDAAAVVTLLETALEGAGVRTG